MTLSVWIAVGTMVAIWCVVAAGVGIASLVARRRKHPHRIVVRATNRPLPKGCVWGPIESTRELFGEGYSPTDFQVRRVSDLRPLSGEDLHAVASSLAIEPFFGEPDSWLRRRLIAFRQGRAYEHPLWQRIYLRLRWALRRWWR